MSGVGKEGRVCGELIGNGGCYVSLELLRFPGVFKGPEEVDVFIDLKGIAELYTTKVDDNHYCDL